MRSLHPAYHPATDDLELLSVTGLTAPPVRAPPSSAAIGRLGRGLSSLVGRYRGLDVVRGLVGEAGLEVRLPAVVVGGYGLVALVGSRGSVYRSTRRLI